MVAAEARLERAKDKTHNTMPVRIDALRPNRKTEPIVTSVFKNQPRCNGSHLTPFAMIICNEKSLRLVDSIYKSS